jgi:hypothetical protein
LKDALSDGILDGVDEGRVIRLRLGIFSETKRN